MALSETETDYLVLAHFKRDLAATVRAQASGRPEIEALLKQASKKTGGTGRGAPDVLAWTNKRPDLLIITENKRSTADHESADYSNPARFAVDGVLHYAEFLAPRFDVVAIAVSGNKADSLRVSTFRWLKGEKVPGPMVERDGRPLDRLLPTIEEYARLLAYDQAAHNRTVSHLNTIGRELNDYFRSIGLDDKKKPLLMSATLLALRDDAFRIGYPKTPNAGLPRFLYDAVKRRLEGIDMPGIKHETLLLAFSFIETDGTIHGDDESSPLRNILRRVEEEVLPHTYDNEEIDAVGAFYQEFLRYRGADQKNKGIVLTPRHVTELFAEIADVRPHQTVLDPCSGSGGFLISAMVRMDTLARDDAERQRIHSRHLIGIELEPEMFALAAVNMIMRGDGKSNLYLGSCFDPRILTEVSAANNHHERPQVGLMNPPYSLDKTTKGVSEAGGKSELEFIETMLDALEPGGTGVAIVPVSCAIGMDGKTKETRRRILSKHTLDAVMTMPPEIFYPTGVHTCVMVFKAGDRHENAKRPTWFGYWKNDGFIKVKHQGRVDPKSNWPAISEHWLDYYRSRTVVPGESVSRFVTADDEWLAEAYMETDFSKLTRTDFENVMRRYAIFKLMNEIAPDEADEDSEGAD